ncbi:unnamed protein product [Phytophthora fragariaefolia]|uniref:Unnamed protein product n=1 Tax=Phytophthora fragariaefolia TaxID=1490495 RepID=A0A9W6X098_9STRA|nr:unnamed protein product [Phytophthora fragariaefolia]
MRVHEAVWRYGITVGNNFTRTYAENRGLLSESDRRSRDSRWLRGSGGLKLRAAWLALDSNERHRLMEACPDATFPDGTNGILDERSHKGREIRQLHASNLVSCQKLLAVSGSNDISASGEVSCRTLTNGGVDTMLSALNSVRVKHFQVVAKEALVELQSVYNQGSLWGSIECVIKSVEASVQITRFYDTPTTPEATLKSVALRLADVFAYIRGTTAFAPDPVSEIPSSSFSDLRVSIARSRYHKTYSELAANPRYVQQSHEIDPPLLPPFYKSFGSIEHA